MQKLVARISAAICGEQCVRVARSPMIGPHTDIYVGVRAVLDGVAAELRRIIDQPAVRAVDQNELRLAA